MINCTNHNHDISENSFVYSTHVDKNLNRQQDVKIVATLRHSHTFYRQVEATLYFMSLNINRDEYYNMQRESVKILQDQLQCALYELKQVDFHVRCHDY